MLWTDSDETWWTAIMSTTQTLHFFHAYVHMQTPIHTQLPTPHLQTIIPLSPLQNSFLQKNKISDPENDQSKVNIEISQHLNALNAICLLEQDNC